MDNLPFLNADGDPALETDALAAPVAEATAPEPPIAEAAEPVAEVQPRAADGKFAAKAAEAAPAAPTQPEPGHVPIGSLLDEREKRQAAERKLAELQARANPTAPQPADPMAAQRYADNLRFSRKFAEREYGKDTIATVHDWAAARCDADPAFNQQMRSSDDPYEAAWQAYNREQILQTVKPDDLAQFKAWQAAQRAVQAAAQTPQPDIAQPPLPRSLATAPGNGAAGIAHVPVGPGEAFRSAIPS